MSLDDGALMARVRRCLEAELELFASGPGARLPRWPGVTASVVAATPDRSLFNSAIADDAGALVAAYDQVAATYRDAGVRAYTFWIDGADVASRDALAARGHVLDSSPVAMAAELATMALPAVGDLDWSVCRDMDQIGRINDAAFGFPPPAFVAARLTPSPRWRGYVARVDGAEVGGLLCHESDDGDCGISAVATLPAAQGTGLATRLLTLALEQARSRGAVTTTLQASPRGQPVYARLGYRALGGLQMWEHRVTG